MKSKFSPLNTANASNFTNSFNQTMSRIQNALCASFRAKSRLQCHTHTHTQKKREIAYGPTGKRDTFVENLAQFKHDGCSISHVNNNLIWCRCLRLLEANVECDFVRMNSTQKYITSFRCRQRRIKLDVNAKTKANNFTTAVLLNLVQFSYFPFEAREPARADALYTKLPRWIFQRTNF